MDVRALVRYLPMSAQKLRLVADQVRGMDAEQALVVLKFMPQKGAKFASKLIASAVANAEENFELNKQDLYVDQIWVDEGPRQKRVKAGARGRYKPRVKRSCHMTVILKEHDYSNVASTASKESVNNGA